MEIPDNPTGIWVNDYTIQPENGGLSVFAHEFAHDLGLPDVYDTSGNSGGAENSTGFWTLMSQSRGTAPGDPGIGDRAQPFGAWDKFQLGWLDYDVVRPQRGGTFTLRPGQSTQRQPGQRPGRDAAGQGGPARARRPVRGAAARSTSTATPATTSTTPCPIDVDAGGALTAKVRYAIEEGWDYAFLEASSDEGETWTDVPNQRELRG